MANSKINFSISKSIYRNIDSMYELDESDVVWNSPPDDQHSPPCLIASKTKTIRRLEVASATTYASLPVDVPDWSKILKVKDNDSAQSQSNPRLISERSKVGENEECFVLDGAGDRVPPHVLVARELAKSTRVAAYSMYEGIGRTLKGRDLSKVRNAIWEITGFQD